MARSKGGFGPITRVVLAFSALAIVALSLVLIALHISDLFAGEPWFGPTLHQSPMALILYRSLVAAAVVILVLHALRHPKRPLMAFLVAALLLPSAAAGHDDHHSDGTGGALTAERGNASLTVTLLGECVETDGDVQAHLTWSNDDGAAYTLRRPDTSIQAVHTWNTRNGSATVQFTADRNGTWTLDAETNLSGPGAAVTMDIPVPGCFGTGSATQGGGVASSGTPLSANGFTVTAFLVAAFASITALAMAGRGWKPTASLYIGAGVVLGALLVGGAMRSEPWLWGWTA